MGSRRTLPPVVVNDCHSSTAAVATTATTTTAVVRQRSSFSSSSSAWSDPETRRCCSSRRCDGMPATSASSTFTFLVLLDLVPPVLLHRLPQMMIIILVISNSRYSTTSTTGSAVADAFPIVTHPNYRPMLRSFLSTGPIRHYHHVSPSRSSPSSSLITMRRFMVNFGPYGDYLNRKVNGDDDDDGSSNSSNKNNNRKETKDDPNHPTPHITSHENISNARFVHQSGDDNDDGNDDDDFYSYYYYQGKETLTTTPKDDESRGNRDRNANAGSPIPSSSSSSSSRWIPSSSSSHSLLLQGALDPMDSEMAAGTVRILQIPTTSLKPGGLRLFLVMYALGAIPAHFTFPLWKVDRPSHDEYVIDLYFHDHSAILSIELIPSKAAGHPDDDDDDDNNNGDGSNSNNTNMPSANDGNTGIIYIHRIGSAPSVRYRLHEATLLQGLLHELQTCATDANISIEDRLCTWTNTTLQQVQTIRLTLPFG